MIYEITWLDDSKMIVISSRKLTEKHVVDYNGHNAKSVVELKRVPPGTITVMYLDP